MPALEPSFSIVVAYAQNRVIGRDNTLPWHLSADLKHFKTLTLGKTMLMGRKTYDAIGKLLPGRQTIILTRNDTFSVPGATIIHDIALIDQCVEASVEIMVVGGAMVYKIMLPLCDKLYVTEVKTTLAGDTFFPEIDLNVWQEVSREPHFKDENNDYDYDFVLYTRSV